MFFKIKDYADLQAAVGELTTALQAVGGIEERIFDCKLVVCELVGNVFKHTKGTSALQATLDKEFVTIKVFSETYFELPKQIVCSEEYCEHGRGLFLIKELCQELTSEQDGFLVKLKVK